MTQSSIQTAENLQKYLHKLKKKQALRGLSKFKNLKDPQKSSFKTTSKTNPKKKKQENKI